MTTTTAAPAASVPSFFSTLEADVANIVGKIKTDVAVAEADLNTALLWVAGQVPAIVSAVETVLGLAGTLGVAANPEVATAIADANLAVQGLNAFATAENAGQSGTSAVVAGYVAVKSATAAVAGAAATTAQTAPAAVQAAPVAAPAAAVAAPAATPASSS